MANFFLSGDRYLQLPRDPQQWVIKDLIPVSGLTNVYGKPKAGKSFAMLRAAAAIANGEPEWLGFAVQKHGPVAYLQVDTPRGEWAGRVNGFQSKGIDFSNVHIADMLMIPSFPFNILDGEQMDALRESVAALQPVVVFIDTLREVHPLDENDSTAMRNVVSQLVAACRPAAIVLISHSRKDTMFSATGGDDLMNDARGSSYIAGRMDAIVKFTTDGKRCTGMLYKGRSVGQGALALTQDETGEVILDGEAALYHELVHTRTEAMRAENPDVTINAIVEDILTRSTYRGARTVGTHVKDHLQSLGLQTKVAKKGRMKYPNRLKHLPLV